MLHKSTKKYAREHGTVTLSSSKPAMHATATAVLTMPCQKLILYAVGIARGPSGDNCKNKYQNPPQHSSAWT
jgi:hypothetical protein